jgi:hypothetical protein
LEAVLLAVGYQPSLRIQFYLQLFASTISRLCETYAMVVISYKERTIISGIGAAI